MFISYSPIQCAAEPVFCLLGGPQNIFLPTKVVLNVNRIKQQKLGSGFLVLLSVPVVVVAALEGLWIPAVLVGLAGLMGAALYVGIRRYRAELKQFYVEPVDYASPPAFAYTLLETVGLGVVFGLALYIAVYVGLVAPVSEWVPATDRLVILAGTVLGLALGAGYPPVMQRQDLVPMLSVGQWATQLDAGLFFTAFMVLLFGPDPLSVLAFGVTYFGSRLAVLGGIHASARPDRNRA